MIISIISQLEKGKEISVNEKGCDELEIDPANDITAFSFEKNSRYIGIQGNLYRLSRKSYKELKKYLQKTNSIYVR